MKTEEQIADKLETLVNALVEISNKSELTDEEQCQLCFLLGGVFATAFVLDAEEELKPFMRMAKYESIVQKLEKV